MLFLQKLHLVKDCFKASDSCFKHWNELLNTIEFVCPSELDVWIQKVLARYIQGGGEEGWISNLVNGIVVRTASFVPDLDRTEFLLLLYKQDWLVDE